MAYSRAIIQVDDGVTGVPLLVKGEVRLPPPLSRREAEEAFKKAGGQVSYVKLPGVQIIRRRVVDRRSLAYTGEFRFQALPQLNPWEMVETDAGKLAGELYSLPVDDILDYLDAVYASLRKDTALIEEVKEMVGSTSPFPDVFLNAWFDGMASSWRREQGKLMIDRELSFWGRPGSDFLNGWVELDASFLPGVTANAAGEALAGIQASRGRAYVRAMPTRQLHLTAGNAPDVPLASLLRALLTKSAAVIKLPSAGIVTGTLFAAAAAAAAPQHPLTRHLSVVYWKGGDEEIENTLFAPGVFDRIIVWGGLGATASVQARAAPARTIFFNPRYGVSLIGREAFEGDLAGVAAQAASDSLVNNQASCASSLVHYVEGSLEQAGVYAGHLCRALAGWDEAAPPIFTPSLRGEFKRLKHGKYTSAHWFINTNNGEYSSGVVVVSGGFDITDHPGARLVAVCPVSDLSGALKYLHAGVSVVGIYPEERRLALRDILAARGVSSILPLGRVEQYYAGMPHDGMLVLNQLVDWKRS
jgi:hypothetical protein